MACVDRVGTRYVVLEIESRKLELRIAESFVLIAIEVGGRLEDNEVEIERANTLVRNLVHPGRARPATSAVAAGAVLDRQIPVMLDTRDRVQIAPVDVPDKNLEDRKSTRL